MKTEGDETVAVLVVDDQTLFRNIARSLVAVLPGWTVVGEADSGEQGVSLAERIRPDVVLMDVYLPGINGIEATRRIVAANPAMTVLLMSTYDAEDLPGGVDGCGAAGYVRKDELTPASLRALLRTG